MVLVLVDGTTPAVVVGCDLTVIAILLLGIVVLMEMDVSAVRWVALPDRTICIGEGVDVVVFVDGNVALFVGISVCTVNGLRAIDADLFTVVCFFNGGVKLTVGND